MRAIILATSLLALTACGTAGPQPIDLSRMDQVINTARALCRQSAPVLAAASLIPDPRVAAISVAVNGLCGPLLAGSVPATVDGNTPLWINGNIADLQKLLAAGLAAAGR